MVYSSKQQPTTPLLVVGHEISFGNGDSASNNSRRGGNGGNNHHQMAMSSNGGGGGGGLGDVSSGSAGGGSSAYWNRSPVALNKSSNRYIDQSKAFIEDAYVKRGEGGRSPYYQQPPPKQQQAMNRHGGYYAGNNNFQPNSRTNSMPRPPTNRPNPAATSAAPMNDDDLSEVSQSNGEDTVGT